MDEQAGELGADERLEAVVRCRASSVESGEGRAVLEQKLGTTLRRLRRGSGEHGDLSIAAGARLKDPLPEG
jgi:hypothetical protein